MKIDDQEYVIIHLFSFRGRDYIIYTLDDRHNVVYFSWIQYHPRTITLEKIDIKESKNLKKVISIFLKQKVDTVFLSENTYHSLSTKQLLSNKIQLHDCVLIRLSNQKYNEFVTKKI